MTIDGDDQLEGLRAGGTQAVADTRDTMLAAVEPGIATGELDVISSNVLRTHGARSAPQLAVGFPGTTCISVNNEAAHGVPSEQRRSSWPRGDLVNIDVSAELDGYWADTGASAPVGRGGDPLARRLVEATRLAQSRDAMNQARAGRPLRNIGRAVAAPGPRPAGLHRHRQPVRTREWAPASTSRPACRASRNNPEATRPCCGRAWCSPLSRSCRPAPPTPSRPTTAGPFCTPDGSLSAQFEHTVVVTNGAPLVMTVVPAACPARGQAASPVSRGGSGYMIDQCCMRSPSGCS